MPRPDGRYAAPSFIGLHVKAAMNSSGPRSCAFLENYASLAYDAGMLLLDAIPDQAEVDLSRFLRHLGRRLGEDAESLAREAGLDQEQTRTLLAAAQRGFERFLDAYLDARLACDRPNLDVIREHIRATLAEYRETS